MLRINIFFILLLSCFSQTAWAQTDEEKNLHKLAFNNYLDSLKSYQRYDLIIDTCLREKASYLDRIRTCNLIGAYYFLGEKDRALNLFQKEINFNSQSVISLQHLLTYDYAVYKHFLLESGSKALVVQRIDSLYSTLSDLTHPEEGRELLHLFLEDQWLRYESDAYNKLKPERRFLHKTHMPDSIFLAHQANHTDSVFSFYVRTNKLFGEKEVGQVSYFQSALLFHEWDLKRREYYHSLVRKIVEEGHFSIEFLMNFEGGTQYIILGVDEYFRQRDQIQNDLRIKYNKPNYWLRLI